MEKLNRHHIELRCPTGDPNDTEVYLDGERVRGLVAINFDLDARNLKVVTVSMELEVTLEAGFSYLAKVFEGPREKLDT